MHAANHRTECTLNNNTTRHPNSSTPQPLTDSISFDFDICSTINALNRTKPVPNHDGYDIKLKIGSCNIAGIERNGEYANELAMFTDVLFLCETWHSKHQHVDDCIKLLNKNVRSKAGARKSAKGRNPGGIAFIFNSELNVACSFPSRRIGILKLNKLAILGVYLPSADSTNKTVEEIEYRTEIEILDKCLSEQNLKGYEVVVVGDFNKDFDRACYRTELLSKLMRKHSLIALDRHYKQDINYTYLSKGESNYKSSWIDHFLCRKFGLYSECKIVASNANLSDHNAIIAALTLSCSREFRSSHTKPVKPAPVINWNDVEQMSLFKDKVRTGLSKLEFEIN